MPPLHRCATFEGDRFRREPPAAGPDPWLAGEDAAGWLRSRLPPELKPGSPIGEDYRWGIWMRSGEDPYRIAIGLMDQPRLGRPRPHPEGGQAP